MIVFERSKRRKDNFEFVRSNIIPDVLLFPAADTINEYEKYKRMSDEMKCHTSFYMNKWKSGGKLGCNMSHILLLQHLQTLPSDWFLVLEDDILFQEYDKKTVESLIEIANKNQSHYVHLYTNPEFLEKQKRAKQVAPDVYTMIPQWHTLAFLIDKKGIEITLSKLPYNNHIDHIYSDNIRTLNAICYLNTMFRNGGSDTCGDKSSTFGSLIYKLRSRSSAWNA
jgi:hypothetical protein